jgi:hypothetical protein
VEENEIKSWLSSGIVVAYVSAIGYSVTFLYEYGYTQYFQIPTNLIQLTLTQVFLAISGMGLVAYVYFTQLKIIASVESLFQHDILRLMIAYQVPILLFLLFVGFLYGETKGWILLGVLFLFFLFDDFLYPLIIQRWKGTYREKIVAQLRTEMERPRITKMLLGPALNSKKASFLLYTAVFILLSFLAGHYEARSQIYFYVLSESPNVVLLRIYGENVVCASFDRKEKEISGSLTIQSLSDRGELKLRREKIGPLKVKQEKPVSKNQSREKTEN